MKKTLIILSLLLAFATTNAQSESTWEETITWIKSKSSYYNIYYTSFKEFKQSFTIYNDDTYHFKEKATSLSYELPNRKGQSGYFVTGCKGSLYNLKPSWDIESSDDDYSVKEIRIKINSGDGYMYNTGISNSKDTYTEKSFIIQVKDRDDMPKRLLNAFNRLAELGESRKKQMYLQKKNAEDRRIKSYGEKF